MAIIHSILLKCAHETARAIKSSTQCTCMDLMVSACSVTEHHAWNHVSVLPHVRIPARIPWCGRHVYTGSHHRPHKHGSCFEIPDTSGRQMG